MVVPTPEEVNDAKSGVGGWLLLLCLSLLIWHPVDLAVSSARSLTSLQMRGMSMGVVVLARLLVAGIGVGAGLALLGRRRGAATIAKWSLVLSALMDLFVYLTPFLPSNRLPGTTPLFVAASMTYYGIWFAYLWTSKRVRNTFPMG